MVLNKKISKIIKNFLAVSIIFIQSQIIQCQNNNKINKIITGADVLIADSISILKGKKIGLVCNQTSRISKKDFLPDILIKNSAINLIKIFTPEHGFKGNAEAGKIIVNNENPAFYKSARLISLYGKSKKPKSEDLQNLDLIVFDIQDIGVRYYTYISTLYYVIQACAENNLSLLILDRPNPIAAYGIDGTVTKKKFKSFISIFKLPILHSLTIGELALLFNDSFQKKANIKIIKCKYFKRNIFNFKYFNDWIKPSPNIPDFETALIYPITCYFEGTNVSEGRGTLMPFKQFGAPFINSDDLKKALDNQDFTGINFKTTQFTPKKIPEMSEHPKYKNEVCNGIEISITNPKKIEPFKYAYRILLILKNLYPQKFKFKKNHFDLLMGTNKIRTLLLQGTPYPVVEKNIKPELLEFRLKSEKFHLY